MHASGYHFQDNSNMLQRFLIKIKGNIQAFCVYIKTVIGDY